MKWLSVLLAVSGMITGLIAAWYWLRASMVRVEPLRTTIGKIEEIVTDHNRDMAILDMIKAVGLSSKLNAIAARWTATAVMLGGLTTIVSLWPL